MGPAHCPGGETGYPAIVLVWTRIALNCRVVYRPHNSGRPGTSGGGTTKTHYPLYRALSTLTLESSSIFTIDLAVPGMIREQLYFLFPDGPGAPSIKEWTPCVDKTLCVPKVNAIDLIPTTSSPTHTLPFLSKETKYIRSPYTTCPIVLWRNTKPFSDK